jgi:hypothetical protein
MSKYRSIIIGVIILIIVVVALILFNCNKKFSIREFFGSNQNDNVVDVDIDTDMNNDDSYENNESDYSDYSVRNISNKSEINIPDCNTSDIDQYFVNASDDIKDLLVDRMPCSPECCGPEVSAYSNLNENDLKKRLVENVLLSGNSNGNRVWTGYSCYGGCPCVSKKAYANIINRGQSTVINDDNYRQIYY